MNNQIYPCLWFDGQAKAAAELYCSLFGNSKITVESPLVVRFELDGFQVMGLNGGPMFRINPSISLYVTCGSVDEIDRLWAGLSEGGFVMMPLDTYPWSRRYGWLVDKFGMTWQLTLGDLPAGAQKIVPALLFVGDQFGQAQNAINQYIKIFPDSRSLVQELYGPDEEPLTGNLKFGQFSLGRDQFIAMDGPGTHEFGFNEGVSFVVECDTQEEIDHYWDTLCEGGNESQCGWLKDRFGVSWQIVPKVLASLMDDPDRGARVMEVVLKSGKLIIRDLLNS